MKFTILTLPHSCRSTPTVDSAASCTHQVASDSMHSAWTRFLVRGLAFLIVIGTISILLLCSQCYAQDGSYFRLQLKHGNGGFYLGLKNCTGPLALTANMHEYGGVCNLWRFIPAGNGWSRLQLKRGGAFLDADHCASPVGLNGGSEWENGACQLWRLVPSGSNGWFRLQLKHGGEFLDVDHCSTKLGLNKASSWEGGACQLWRKLAETPSGYGNDNQQ